MNYEFNYNYLIKIISKEKIIYENAEYKNIIAKFCYSDKKTFKQGYE